MRAFYGLIRACELSEICTLDNKYMFGGGGGGGGGVS